MEDKYLEILFKIGYSNTHETGILANALHEIDNIEETQSKDVTEFSTIGYYWVATALATGALEWIGNKVMQSLFGSTVNESSDIARLLNNLIEKFQDIVRQEITESSLRQCRADLNSVQTNFLEYLNAPTEFRLEITSQDSTKAVNGLKSMKLPGHSAYISAVSIKLLILQERIKVFEIHRKGELQNTLDLINQSVEYHKELSKAWETWNFSLYKLETQCAGDFCGFWVVKNQIPLLKVGKYGLDKVEPFIQMHSKKTFINDVYPKYIAQADEVIRQWIILANAIQWSLQNENFDVAYLLEITQKIANGTHIQDL
jgi:hypothetical protein